jgi:hypothetical protein
MILQPRDHLILHSLAHFGILSSTQVMHIHFKGIAHTTMMKRLRVLAKERFIIKVMGLPKSECAWSLSKKGAEAIQGEAPNSYNNQNIVVHEVELTNVRLALEKMGLGQEFTSEMTLRRGENEREARKLTDKTNVPDGIFLGEFTDGFGMVALEVELHPKNHARYEKVFNDYAGKTSLKYVWYLVSESGIGNTVIAQWKKVDHYKDSPKLLVSLLPELKTKLTDTTIYTTATKKKIPEIFKIESHLLSENKISTPVTPQSMSTS